MCLEAVHCQGNGIDLETPARSHSVAYPSLLSPRVVSVQTSNLPKWMTPTVREYRLMENLKHIENHRVRLTTHWRKTQHYRRQQTEQNRQINTQAR